ncbi:hypothetical protein FGO68_gene565 [Halteria grandinella]|uniref:EF-hand domain-containing protein n=1 Tax=Halteria grandinella TaxID=5974 RepID=A0A8J8P3D9_HALGN|nr:hypothetical protein FGO68_gene565 [Halteria grandinella]
MVIYTGTEAEQRELLFKMFDIHQKGLILKGDLRLFLIHALSPRHQEFHQVFESAIKIMKGQNYIPEVKEDGQQERPEISLKFELIDMLLDKIYGINSPESKVLTKEEFTQPMNVSDGHKQQSPQTTPPQGNHSIDRFIHVTRMLLDYMKLMLPCSFYFEHLYLHEYKEVQIKNQQQQISFNAVVLSRQNQFELSQNALHRENSVKITRKKSLLKAKKVNEQSQQRGTQDLQLNQQYFFCSSRVTTIANLV